MMFTIAQLYMLLEQYERGLQALDAWWAEVEPVANQPQRIIIGSDAENPMLLSACEWQDVFVDQQRTHPFHEVIVLCAMRCHR